MEAALVTQIQLTEKQVRASLSELEQRGEIEVVRVVEHGEQAWGPKL